MDKANISDAIQKVYRSLTEEQKEKADACESFEDLIKYFGSVCIPLPDELLEVATGGFDPAELARLRGMSGSGLPRQVPQGQREPKSISDYIWR